MTTYLVTTVSRFSNKYFIEAESEEQAIEFALDSDTSDFYQIHLGEEAALVEIVEIVDKEVAIHKLRAMGYF